MSTVEALAISLAMIGAAAILAFGIGFPLMRIADEMVLRRAAAAAREKGERNG